MLIEDVQGLYDRPHHICVVGAGPVGLVVAVELARLGHDVLLLESGTMRPDAATQQLSSAVLADPQRHADMAVAVQRRFGGTSNLWGAGCVPLDPVDFESRPVTGDLGWPISYAEFAAHLPAACRYANCGDTFEQQIAGIGTSDHPDFTADTLMRFADPPSFRTAYARQVAASRKIVTALGTTVTAIRFTENGLVCGLEVCGRDGSRGVVRSRIVVLACGGIETTRLLLSTQIEAPRRFGGEDGPLGRYYMGHLSGTIADIRFASTKVDKAFDYFLGTGVTYARRRFVASAELQRQEQLTNVALWPTLPPMRDPAHRDPVLSLAYLALSVPPLGRRLVSESLRRINVGDGKDRLAHLRNVILGLPSISRTLPRFLRGRFFDRVRLPGLHLRNPALRYTLHYHGEHLPQRQSRISLSRERDAFGLPKAVLDLRFSEADANPITRMHEHLASWLTSTGIGELSWHQPKEQNATSILAQAGDGFHQIGSARMAETWRLGVVNRDCRAFGSDNLFVAGSAVFSTSGQANPTLSALALAIRSAHLIAAEVLTHAI
jgi:2-polyprenyl-6-methoxyphenol hydroxylase-like FAD-dependent oxidoreductase